MSTPFRHKRLVSPGARFGRWQVVREAEAGPRWQRRFLCHCVCGVVRTVTMSSLVRGFSKSCGCLSRDAARERMLGTGRHGHCRNGKSTSEYQAWRSMQVRCYNPRCGEYPNYGARGITVCDSWRQSFDQFLHDMGAKPSPQHWLDRIDNDQGYRPANCRWALPVEQQRNRRSNRLITIDGVTLCACAWAERMGIQRETLYARLQKGWGEAEAVLTPVQPRTPGRAFSTGGR
jgi:hypothetical protein